MTNHSSPILIPTLIQYRNGIYQGSKSISHSPSGPGLFFDDNFILHCCASWKQSLQHGPTAILISHGKYIYGNWENGVPSGFNVFREGEIVVLGNFKEGRTEGRFAVVFEKHGFVVIGYPTEDSFVVEFKREYGEMNKEGEEELKKVIMSSVEGFEENYFSFVRYLNSYFCGDESQLSLQILSNRYRFGFNEGMGVVFDDYNYIQKIGKMNSEEEMNGLGVCYLNGLVSAGNFENQMVIKYQQKMKPTKDLNRLFKIQHKKSINFKNDYLMTKQAQVIKSLERIIKMVIDAVVENPIETKRYLRKQELNDSLDYNNGVNSQVNRNQNERLKMIRQQLHKSIGLPSGVKPSSNQLKYLSKYPSEMRQLNYKPFSTAAVHQFQPVSPEFRRNNRTNFLRDNHLQDYRLRQIHRPLTTKKIYQSQVPALIEDHVNYQIHKSRQSKQSRKNSPKIKRREASFSPSPIYSVKDTDRNSPNKSIKQFGNISIVRKNSNQLEINESFNPKQYHINQKVEELIEQIVSNNNSNVKNGDSPYKRHALDSIRDSNIRGNLPINYSRSYIPVSHQKRKEALSPQKKAKQKETQKKQPHSKLTSPKSNLTPLDRTARSYLEIFRTGASPNKPPSIQQTPKTKIQKSSTPKKTTSQQRKQNDRPTTVKTQNINHLYFRKKQHATEARDDKNKLIEEITKKYNKANH